ncbi:uncharacterized protein K441DRAFT_675688 [Cenococcum geophilum 1.58]|uniref:uncharacterized protein n=1 Tax=Cenococcum geophilum 1.58 TaxID=794803 RepID=UPI00358E7486|nr:hypothetical protein K441DRAFT_675688 [Cenococcum geophilum 1.58]
MTDQLQCPPSPRPSTPPTPPSPSHRAIKLSLFTGSLQVRPVNRTLARANSHLSEFRPKAALELYTQVLTKISPGHPCAFLNRSLCYLILGFPSLAVTDAYRALLAAYWARHSKPPNAQARQLFLFGKFTQEADELEHAWITDPSCYVGVGLFFWLSKDLASLAVEPKNRSKKKKPIESLGKTLVSIANDAMMKAYYRLALALWKCGGGALKSALDVLDDAQSLRFCTPDDMEQFKELGNRILLDIENVIKEENQIKQFCIASQGMREDSDTLKFYEEYGIRGLLKTRFTKIKRELYPWDTYSLTGDNLHQVLAELNEMVNKQAPGCRIGVVREVGKSAQLSLYAKEHFLGPATIFNEMSCFHVTSLGWDFRQKLPCDACAASLDVSGPLCVHANRIAKELARDEEKLDRMNRSAALSQDSNATEFFDVAEYIRNTSNIKEEEDCSSSNSEVIENAADDKPQYTLSQEATSSSFRKLPPTPPGLSSPLLSNVSLPQETEALEGFQLCPACRRVAFCSARCHSSAISAYHIPSCSMRLEEYLRAKILSETWKDVPKPYSQRLLNLLFLRILANARPNNTHPLEQPWIRCLDGKLDAARDVNSDWEEGQNEVEVLWDEEKTVSLEELFPDRESLEELAGEADAGARVKQNLIPWSFDTNVRQPLHCLFTMGGPELALDVRRFDGWVLETVRAKIAAGMRVSRFPRFEKAFDEKGELVAQACVKQSQRDNGFDGHSAATGNSTVDETEDDEVTWVASLHPLASLVRVAEEDETPNVKLWEREGMVLCKTYSHIDTLHEEQRKTTTDGNDHFRVEPSSKFDTEMPDFSFDATPSIGAGEPLIRAKEVSPLDAENDLAIDVYRCVVEKAERKSGQTLLFGTDWKETNGDSMLDAADTKWDKEESETFEDREILAESGWEDGEMDTDTESD